MALEQLSGFGYVDLSTVVQVVDPSNADSDETEPNWDSKGGIAIVTSVPWITPSGGHSTSHVITDEEDKQVIRDYCENPSGLDIAIDGLRTQLSDLAANFSGGLGGFFGKKKS